LGARGRGEQQEIDVVALDAERGVVALGSCKWTDRAMDFDQLNFLDRLAPHVDDSAAGADRWLFSRSGFTDRLRRHADDDPRLHLVTPEDIYAR
jgi:hypothetical protein